MVNRVLQAAASSPDLDAASAEQLWRVAFDEADTSVASALSSQPHEPPADVLALALADLENPVSFFLCASPSSPSSFRSAAAAASSSDRQLSVLAQFPDSALVVASNPHAGEFSARALFPFLQAKPDKERFAALLGASSFADVWQPIDLVRLFGSDEDVWRAAIDACSSVPLLRAAATLPLPGLRPSLVACAERIATASAASLSVGAPSWSHLASAFYSIASFPDLTDEDVRVLSAALDLVPSVFAEADQAGMLLEKSRDCWPSSLPFSFHASPRTKALAFSLLESDPSSPDASFWVSISQVSSLVPLLRSLPASVAASLLVSSFPPPRKEFGSSVGSAPVSHVLEEFEASGGIPYALMAEVVYSYPLRAPEFMDSLSFLAHPLLLAQLPMPLLPTCSKAFARVASWLLSSSSGFTPASKQVLSSLGPTWEFSASELLATAKEVANAPSGLPTSF